MQRRSNYLWGHENPWQLAGPPAWWLDMLYATDPDLVLFPSKTMGVYRVARRISTNLQPILHALKSVPDTETYVNNRLAPLTSLLPFANWSPLIIQDLVERNIERFGGFNAAADALDEFDARKEMKDRQATRDMADAISHDSWWSRQFGGGHAVSMAHQTRPERPTTARKQTVYRPLNLQGGASAVFVGNNVSPARTTGRKVKPYVAPDTYVGGGNARSLIITP